MRRVLMGSGVVLGPYLVARIMLCDIGLLGAVDIGIALMFGMALNEMLRSEDGDGNEDGN